jgi:hypothetical protein
LFFDDKIFEGIKVGGRRDGRDGREEGRGEVSILSCKTD